MKMKIRSCSSLQYVSVCLSVFLSVYPSMAASLAAQYVGAAMKIIITTHYQQYINMNIKMNICYISYESISFLLIHSPPPIQIDNFQTVGINFNNLDLLSFVYTIVLFFCFLINWHHPVRLRR